MAGMREVYRAGWLKKITSDDKKKSFKNPRVEKVWMVFCVHDEQSPFLEQYGSRQAAAGHQPEFGYPLAECYHVSASIRPTLPDEHEFVITLRQDVVKFSSSRSEVINDWISILRNQLHELKVLESKSNLYSKAPRQQMQFGLQRDPNSPLPAPPPLPVLNSTLLEATVSPRSRTSSTAPAAAVAATAAVVSSSAATSGTSENTYSESPVAAVGAAPAAGAGAPAAVGARRGAPAVPVTVRAAPVTPPASPPAHWIRFDEPLTPPSPPAPPTPPTPPTPPSPRPAGGTAAAASAEEDGDESRHVTVISVGEALRLTVPDTAGGGGEAVPPGGSSSPPRQRRMTTPARPAPAPPAPQRTLPEWGPDRQLFGPAPARADSGANSVLYERLSEASSSAAASTPPTAAPRSPPAAGAAVTTTAARPSDSSEPGRPHSAVQRSHSSVPQQRPSLRPPLHRQTSDTSLDSRAGAASRPRPPTDATHREAGGGRQLSLREHQVLALRREIAHRPGVRMVLPRRTVSSALALADGYGAVWLAGWRWKEQPALACALHVGDRIASVAGLAVSSAAEFSRVIRRHQPPVVELVVQRMPHAMVVAMKREHEGQSLGLTRDGGTGEVLQVLPDGLAASHGLPARSGAPDCLSLCNWYITEVNSRAVSLFSKGDELGSRLAAVGRDISLVLQPADLVRLLKRHLKTVRGYKQFVVQ